MQGTNSSLPPDEEALCRKAILAYEGGLKRIKAELAVLQDELVVLLKQKEAILYPKEVCGPIGPPYA